jgi:NitT/TauT family transport system substrate-binding protein
MNRRGNEHWSRREFLRTATLVGTGVLLGFPSETHANEPPPETKRIRIPQTASTCRTPEWMAEELLRSEGFSDIQYVPIQGTLALQRSLASGEADIGAHFAAPVILRLEAGDPIVIVGGEHVGCFELLGSERIRTIRDLKGRAVAVPELDPAPYAFLASMISYVGLNPRKDINWVKHRAGEAMQLLAEGKIDAYLGFPTEPQAFRAKKVGRVVVNSAVDRPWSQYFCCMLTGNREFVRTPQRHQARHARHPEIGRNLRRRSGEGRQVDHRQRHWQKLCLRSRGHKKPSVRTMARVRRRRHRQVLGPSSA